MTQPPDPNPSDALPLPAEPEPLTVPAFVAPQLEQLGVPLDAPTLAQMARYLAMLLQANSQFNLTAVRDPEQAWRRHIIDSLTVVPGLDDLPPDAQLIDVGSGGGLPGIPLALARPKLRVTLLEATGKKARFLESCVALLPLPGARVLAERAEVVGQDAKHRQQYDAAVCRAIGPMREVLEYTLPLIRVGGRLLAMKGPKAEDELRDAADAMDKLGAGEMAVYGAYPEGSDQNTVIITIEKARPTPKTYPRRPGVPRQMPL